MFPALITALLLGLRHGSDIDHVAAISDLSATEGGGLRAFRLSTVYAVGHAAVLLDQYYRGERSRETALNIERPSRGVELMTEREESSGIDAGAIRMEVGASP